MRCKACNVELTDVEATRKDERGEFIDLCGSCGRESWLTETYDDYDPEITYEAILGSELFAVVGGALTKPKYVPYE